MTRAILGVVLLLACLALVYRAHEAIRQVEAAAAAAEKVAKKIDRLLGPE